MTMGHVLPLSHTAKLVYSHYLLSLLGSENSSELFASQPACHEMETVVHHLLKYYPHLVTTEMLLALAPVHQRELCLDTVFKHHACSPSARQLKTEHIAAIMKKCLHLDQLSLAECPDIQFDQLFHLAGPSLSSLVSVVLDSCADNVKDSHVQMLLKGAKRLRHLNLANTNVTDEALLLDQPHQLGQETFTQEWKIQSSEPHQNWTSSCVLASVDLSGCSNITSTGIRHLCSLAGHSLRSLDISCTQADFTSLLYLSGLSLPDAVYFSLDLEVDVEEAANFPIQQLRGELDRCRTMCQSLEAHSAAVESVPLSANSESGTHTADSKFVSQRAHDPDGLAQSTHATENTAQSTVSNFVPQNVKTECRGLKADTTDLQKCDACGCEKKSMCPHSTEQKWCSSDRTSTGLHPMEQTHNNDASSSQHQKTRLKETEITCENCEKSSKLAGDVHNTSGEVTSVLKEKSREAGDGHDRSGNITSTLMETSTDDTDGGHSRSGDVTGMLKDDAEVTESSASHDVNPLMHTPPSTQLRGGWCEHKMVGVTDVHLEMDTDISSSETETDSLQVQMFPDCQQISSQTFSSQCLPEDTKLRTHLPVHVCFHSSDTDSKTAYETSTITGCCSQIHPNSSSKMSQDDLPNGASNILHHENGFQTSVDVALDCNICEYIKKKTKEQFSAITDDGIEWVHGTAKVPSGSAEVSEESVTGFAGVGKNPVFHSAHACTTMSDSVPGTDSASCSFSFAGKSFTPSKCASNSDEDTVSTVQSSSDRKPSVFMDRHSSEDTKEPDAIDKGASENTTTSDGEPMEEHVSEPQLLFTPNIASLCLSSDCLGGLTNTQLGLACFEKLLTSNSGLQSISIVCSPRMPLVDQALVLIGQKVPGLRHLSLDAAETVTDFGISQVLTNCTSLTKLDLAGAPFISDTGLLPLQENQQLEELILSESSVAAPTLLTVAVGMAETLRVLDLAWCENVDESSINRALRVCTQLTRLNLRQCPVSSRTLVIIAAHCTRLTDLGLSCVKDISDAAVTSLVSCLGELQSVDLSWNLDLTDECVSALLACCPLLHTAELSGLKLITSSPFLPIISNVGRWRRLKMLAGERCRAKQETGSNAVAQRLHNYRPRRSTSYATCLKHLYLHYCDQVTDAHMEEVAYACDGALTIINYYGEPATPKINWNHS